MMRTNDVILQTVTKVTLYLIILFSIHVFFAGHYQPGGGFIAGLMISGALVLLLLATDKKTVTTVLRVDYRKMIAVGLLFAVGTGMLGLFNHLPFLTHFFDHFDLPIIGDTSLHTAALFDFGVFLVVVGVTMTIIQTIGEAE